MPFDSTEDYIAHKNYDFGYQAGLAAGRAEKRTPPIPDDPADRRPSKIVPTCDCFVEKGMTFDQAVGLHRCSKCGQFEDYSERSAHQQRVQEFMILAGQVLPDKPTMPEYGVREFRCRLVLEECLELIAALGFNLHSPNYFVTIESLYFVQNGNEDLVAIADGGADLSVVTTGTLLACGIKDNPVLEAVDQNNLDKFKPRCPNCNDTLHLLGGDGVLTGNPGVDTLHTGWSCWSCESQYPKDLGGYRREDGKWVKGTVHKKVDLESVLKRQGA